MRLIVLTTAKGYHSQYYENGSWQRGTATPVNEPGAPTVNNVQVNGTSTEIGPFTTAGTRPPRNMLYVDGQLVVANPLVNVQSDSYTLLEEARVL